MPTYAYVCKDCKKSFSIMLSLRDHGRNKVACPKCQSKKVEQAYAAFFAVSAKKS
jgi:putative FmdB family regulatory protein